MKKFNSRPNEFVTKENIGERGFWIPRSCAVVGVIVAKIKNDYFVLINKRGVGAADNNGKYNLCCGYLDWDETGPDAITREVYEESGVDLDFIKTKHNIIYDFTNQPFFVNTSPKENRQNVSLSYGLIFETNNLPKTTNKFSEVEEVEDIVWANIKNLNNYDFAFNHNERIKLFMQSFFNQD